MDAIAADTGGYGFMAGRGGGDFPGGRKRGSTDLQLVILALLAVENLPQLRDKLAAICGNYLSVQQDILETFVDRGQLRKLTEPTVLPSGKRIPGLKVDHPRQLALMHALVRFAHIAAGSTFTTPELYPYVLAALQMVHRPIQTGFASVRSLQIESQGVG